MTSCSFSHDGFYAVSGSDLDYSVKVWEVATGECIHNITGNDASKKIFFYNFYSNIDMLIQFVQKINMIFSSSHSSKI